MRFVNNKEQPIAAYGRTGTAYISSSLESHDSPSQLCSSRSVFFSHPLKLTATVKRLPPERLSHLTHSCAAGLLQLGPTRHLLHRQPCPHFY
ncbi:hypothetical protein AAFF_G00218360 [Aldrovandia affinis]|uniref:Uncharacterized protein n=1 Tax=Aldrovandia affinis TaxID=143900 RepID=A0AAD7SX69_9TELE|nr:hypothetical protein AAFF_G00218360 [Aldrovandia affinis]